MEMMTAGGLTHQWLREALGIKPGTSEAARISNRLTHLDILGDSDEGIDLYAHYSFHMNSCKAPALLIV